MTKGQILMQLRTHFECFAFLNKYLKQICVKNLYFQNKDKKMPRTWYVLGTQCLIELTDINLSRNSSINRNF